MTQQTLLNNRYTPYTLFILGAINLWAFAPYGIWPIALITAIILGESIRLVSAKRAAFLAWLFGIGFWASGTSWLYVSIHDYGNTPAFLAIPMVLILAMFMASFFALIAFVFIKLHLQHYRAITWPALWVLGESLRTWVLSGFPWLFTGYSVIDTPLVHFAPIFGVFGVSFFALLSAYALCAIYQKKWRYPALIVVTLIWGLAFSLKSVEWTTPTNTRYSISVIQGNIPQESKWQLEWRDKTIDIYRKLSQNEWGRDLVIWPEAAIPMFYHEAEIDLKEMENNALTGHSSFITGIPYADIDYPNKRFWIYNSIIALGEGSGIYHKQRLVPFGEYIPLEGLLRGLLPFFDMPMTSFSSGGNQQSPLKVQQSRLGPLICYEIAYPELARIMSKKSDFLITISNDGWFGHSAGPLQHFDIVRMRAKENGREIIRSTNNGISAIINTQGLVRTQIPQFTAGVLQGEIHTYQGQTPYNQTGSWPILSFCILLLSLCGYLYYAQEKNQ